MKKNQLNYSPLTDTVYYVDGRGSQIDLKQNFIQMMLAWFHETLPMMKVGEKRQRSLRVKNKVHWILTIERLAPKD